MSDIPPLPPDLPRLHAIATYLQLELERVHHRMAEVEQWEASRRASARPAVRPEWTLQMDIGADPRPVAVHHGECSVPSARMRQITRRDAFEALAAGVQACVLCRPDRELQVD
ncbi:DUF6233 domain-containing protein (plasmid) [Streptomyces sp. NBC_01525]|uniref:DUF6233 domain-containing protein n=1 Tax=Streptomyces sp. NBC_01525 TaxID=2903893 RepID=UPI002F913950